MIDKLGWPLMVVRYRSRMIGFSGHYIVILRTFYSDQPMPNCSRKSTNVWEYFSTKNLSLSINRYVLESMVMFLVSCYPGSTVYVTVAFPFCRPLATTSLPPPRRPLTTLPNSRRMSNTQTNPAGKSITRGQWPYRPAAARAMRNRLVVLYDLN